MEQNKTKYWWSSDIHFRIWAVNRAAVHKNKDQNIMFDDIKSYFVS